MSRPDTTVPFHHYPSESGMVPLQLYNNTDRQLNQFFLSRNRPFPPVVASLLGGCGLPILVEFFATLNEENKEKYKDCPILQHPFDKITPELVTEYAEHKNDQLCYDVCYYFLDYTSKYLAD